MCDMTLSYAGVWYMMWLIEGADAPKMCDMTRSYVCDMTLGHVETSCVMLLLEEF